MKRAFIGAINLLMIVLIFVYFACISPQGAGMGPLLSVFAYTGIPVIGMIFIIPAFIFAILYMCIKKPIVEFCKNLFGTFTAIFTLITGVLGFTRMTDSSLYIPLIVTVCASIELLMSVIPLVRALFKKEEE